MNLTDQLATIRARAAADIEIASKATEGPWYWDSGNQAVETAYGSPKYRQDICSAAGCTDLTGEEERDKNYWEMEDDMDFIVHSRTSVPKAAATTLGLVKMVGIYRKYLMPLLSAGELERLDAEILAALTGEEGK